MTNTLAVAGLLSERHGPGPTAGVGLALALLLVVVLLVHQLHAPRPDRSPPGAVRAREPLAARTGRHFYWSVTLVLTAVLVMVVTERFVVLS